MKDRVRAETIILNGLNHFLSLSFFGRGRHLLSYKNHRKRKNKLDVAETTLYQRKKKLIKKFGSNCKICGIKEKTMSVDHIIPLSQGGTSDFNNLRILCLRCNKEKGKLEQEAAQKKIKQNGK